DLVGALRRDHPQLAEELVASLDRGRRLDRRLGQLAQALADELPALGEIVVFVDDHPSVGGVVPLATCTDELVEVLPESTHLILPTRRTAHLRSLPPRPLRRRLLHIPASDLALTCRSA